jgi:mannose-6-phosphate isomerase-like protein (cupin superfamily)
MTPISLAEKFAQISDHWHPRIIVAMNGQEVKLVKFQGPFTWHKHDEADELFLVVEGEFDMQFRDRTVRLRQGELIVVPRGVEHCPTAEREVSVLLFEPAGVVNTGDAGGPQTNVASVL